MGRREFLLGSAIGLASASPLARAATTIAANSGYRVSTRKGRNGDLVSVCVEDGAGHRWTLDKANFAGKTKLTLDELATGSRIRLTGARFAGCKLGCNLEAEIFRKGLSHQIRFTFTKTGVSRSADFSMESKLATWLSGQSPAVTAPLCLAPLLEAPGFVGSFDLDAGTVGRAAYLASGTLSFEGEMNLRRGSDRYSVDRLDLTPSRAVSDSLAETKKRLMTRISLSKSGTWEGLVQLRTIEGWDVTGNSDAFEELTLEAYEGGSGAIRFAGTGGLVASNGRGLSFRLENHELATTYGSEQDTLFAAKLSDESVWVRQPGLHLNIAPQGEALVVHQDRKGRLSGEPALQALQVVPSVEGAIMSAPAHEPVPVSAALDEDGVQSIVVPAVFPFDIVRRADMLNLTFFLINFKLSSSGGKGVLSAANTTIGSYVIVVFPPQALAEETIKEDTSDTVGTFSITDPLRSRLANPTKLVFFVPPTATSIQLSLDRVGGLLDWSRWDQFVAPTALSSFSREAVVKIDPSFGGGLTVDKSKIPLSGFMVPLEGDSLKKAVAAPFTVNKFALEKSSTPFRAFSSVANLFKANSGEAPQPAPKFSSYASLGGITWIISAGNDPTNPSTKISAVPPGRIAVPWYSPYTSIELPTWLTISPDENAAWSHSLKGEIRDLSAHLKYGVLWHTRLATKNQSAIVEFTEDGKWTYSVDDSTGITSGPLPVPASHPEIRAIDAQDYETGLEPVPFDGLQGPTLDHPTRKGLVDNMTKRSAAAGQDSTAFEVERLSLSALGGTLKGEWNLKGTPKLGMLDDLYAAVGAVQQPIDNSLVSWRHVATLGRDHFVKTARRGFLFPTMHQAVLITISERKFQRGPYDAVYAVIRKRQFIIISNPTVNLTSGEQIHLGFQSITCLTKNTPDLDNNTVSASSSWNSALGKGTSMSPNAIWVLVGSAPYGFKMRGLDMDGHNFSWEQPSIFVEWEVGLGEPGSPLPLVDFGSLSAVFNTKNPPGGVSKIPTGGKHVSFAPSNLSDPTKSTALPCDKIQIGGVKAAADAERKIPGFRPILVEADVHVSAVEHLTQSKVASPVQLAKAYTSNNGFGPQNLGEVFLELVKDGTGGNPSGGSLQNVATKFGDVSKVGGLVNPNLSVGALSRLAGAISWPPVDPTSALPTVDVNQYFKGLGAKILGVVDLTDILPSHIDIGGDGKKSPKLTITPKYPTTGGTTLPGGVKVPSGAQVEFLWEPTLHSWPSVGPSDPPPIFQASRKGPKTAWSVGSGPSYNTTLKLQATFRTDFSPPDDGSPSPYYLVDGRITDVTINAIAPVTCIIIGFQRLEFKMESGKASQIYVDTDPIQFAGPLAFVQTLETFLGQGSSGLHLPNSGDQPADETPDTGSVLLGNEIASINPYPARIDDDGSVGFTPYFNIDINGITAGFTLKVPTISVGILAIENISVTGELDLPFLIDPLRVKFSFCTRDDPFGLSVWCITGGGFIGITMGLDGLEIFEGSLEFGASIALDIGVASGSVSLMAGIYFKIQGGNTTLTAYVRLNGSVTVICILTISITFYLGLTYQNTSGSSSLYGTCTVTVEVSLFCFSVGVDMTVTKQIAGSSGPPPSGLIPNDELYASLGQAGSPGPVPVSQIINKPQFATYWGAFGGH